ncbi:hypothetical protein CK203_018970 [Vitis vinifera]|uniref:Uncharacterized protein n=1 Tax=Vitis vinifera TaxID=29760 RepID=A0A438IQT3_VITVI|nr:hypothetical protein CK203_018970 [Vitis vinifera]
MIIVSTILFLHLPAFSHADWASCLDGRCSTSGYCVLLGSSLISSSAAKQKIVPDRGLNPSFKPHALYCDNLSTMCYEYEIISSITPAKMFKAFILDAGNLVPEVLPYQRRDRD